MPTWLHDASQAVYGVTFVAFVVVLVAKLIRDDGPSKPIRLVRGSRALQVLLLVLAVTILISFVELGLLIKHWVSP